METEVNEFIYAYTLLNVINSYYALRVSVYTYVCAILTTFLVHEFIELQDYELNDKN